MAGREMEPALTDLPSRPADGRAGLRSSLCRPAIYATTVAKCGGGRLCTLRAIFTGLSSPGTTFEAARRSYPITLQAALPNCCGRRVGLAGRQAPSSAVKLVTRWRW